MFNLERPLRLFTIIYEDYYRKQRRSVIMITITKPVSYLLFEFRLLSEIKMNSQRAMKKINHVMSVPESLKEFVFKS
ncbi:CLUMA_CG001964, isoform A [Clunio marinus]|uniref:CLUMA_CG001964, isoform A n=1 Tax=Clunio marinus TaxID=568069 RepID=A0A1J1HJT7_9DIPT|nr:CLUMA_CG001964, isoform A [Clunio marinus]